jgi:hypothetical protein
MVTKQYAFRFSDDFIAELDAWRERQPVPPSRTDVIRIAVERFIRSAEQERTKPRAPQKVNQ